MTRTAVYDGKKKDDAPTKTGENNLEAETTSGPREALAQWCWHGGRLTGV